MKTFETEKNNTPEGATHHGIYGCDTDVYFKLDHGVFLEWRHGNWGLSSFNHHDWVKPIPTETPEEKEALDAIEQVEWRDKDEVPPVGWRGLSAYTEEGCDDWCEFHDGVVMGVNGDYVWMAHHGKFQKVHHIGCIEFKEAETPEAKKEREDRERGIHALSMNIMNNVKVNDGSLSDYRHDIAVYLYDAGYRKGE